MWSRMQLIPLRFSGQMKNKIWISKGHLLSINLILVFQIHGFMAELHPKQSNKHFKPLLLLNLIIG